MITKAAYNLLLEIDIDPIRDSKYINNLHKETKIFYKEKFQMTMNNEPNLYIPNIATRKDFDYYLYEKVKTNNIDFFEDVFIKDINFEKTMIETDNDDYQYNYLVFADGANGIIRAIVYAVSDLGNGKIFDRNILPNMDITSNEYNINVTTHDTDSFINLFFEKMLKLKGLMMTKSGKEEAKSRHTLMIDFLEHFFEEENAQEWKKLLNPYCKEELVRILHL